MIPPRYTLFPSAVLLRSDIPTKYRWTYLVLYALAWRHQYHWLDETYQQLSQIFTELEGKEVTPEAIRQRFRRLSEYGLVQRRGSGSQYRTHLVVRHDQVGGLGVCPAYTKSSEPDQLGVSSQIHPIKNRDHVVVDVEGEDQQQQYSNTERIAKNAERLEAMGVLEPVRGRLAKEEHVTPEYLETVKAYREQEASRGKILGPGWVVKCVGEGWEIPKPEPDRYRYIQGKYREWVRH